VKINKSDPYTLEKLIEGLDERGMLVLQVLLGQQAMQLLSDEHVKKTRVLSA
jgi:hypothetical protein